MRLKCPNCSEIVNRARGSYKIAATSDLKFSRDRDIIRPAAAPLEVTSQSFQITQVVCPACNHTDPLEAWTVIVFCPACGEYLAEFPAGITIPASELYCEREGGFLCKECALRYRACEVCSLRPTCPIINKED